MLKLKIEEFDEPVKRGPGRPRKPISVAQGVMSGRVSVIARTGGIGGWMRIAALFFTLPRPYITMAAAVLFGTLIGFAAFEFALLGRVVSDHEIAQYFYIDAVWRVEDWL